MVKIMQEQSFFVLFWYFCLLISNVLRQLYIIYVWLYFKCLKPFLLADIEYQTEKGISLHRNFETTF